MTKPNVDYRSASLMRAAHATVVAAWVMIAVVAVPLWASPKELPLWVDLVLFVAVAFTAAATVGWLYLVISTRRKEVRRG